MKKFVQYIRKRVKEFFAKRDDFAPRHRSHITSLDFAKMLLDMYDSDMAYLAVASGLTRLMRQTFAFPRAPLTRYEGIAV